MARCLALLGMVATHVLEKRTVDGSLSLAQALAGGRASALFAVLAGLSIALVTGRRDPPTGAARARASAGLAVRAALVAVTGLLLGSTGSGIAVILTYYGVLFLLALPFLGLRTGSLAALAVVWGVLAPVVSHVVRPWLPERQFASPTFPQLVDDPLGLLAELTFTGYYPAVPWLAFVLAGLAVGRSELTRRAAVRIAAAGAAIALTATAVSRELTSWPSVQQALLSDPPVQDADAAALLGRIAEGVPGTTPTGGAWQWLLVVAPHTGTPFDLLQATGSALLVIGSCLLAVGFLGPAWQRGIAVFFGAGTMTLTLYALHVLVRSPGVLPHGLRDSFLFHVLLLLAIGSAFAATGTRGPVEQGFGRMARAVAGHDAPRLSA